MPKNIENLIGLNYLQKLHLTRVVGTCFPSSDRSLIPLDSPKKSVKLTYGVLERHIYFQAKATNIGT